MSAFNVFLCVLLYGVYSYFYISDEIMSNSKHFVVPVKRPSNDQNNMPVINPGSTSTSPLQLSFSDWLATPYQLGFSAWLKGKEKVISETEPQHSSILAASSIIHRIKQPKPPNQPDNTIPNVTDQTF